MADEVVSHASAADRQAAVTVATLIQNSGTWYVFGAISLIGEILGFILLGCALWRAGTVPRWAAACISLGPLIHIAGGDIWWTATGGILLLALGLGILARVQLATIMVVKGVALRIRCLWPGALRERGLASAEARRWCARFRAVAGCAPCSPGSR